MKKICILFLSTFILIIAVTFCLFAPRQESKSVDYLRIHIRANSNGEADQSVKYAVRDRVVEYLTPLVANCQTKESAMQMVNSRLSDVSALAKATLQEQGFSYGATATLKCESFPTRVYEEYTLPAGEYDALILALGEGEGDNWWCCIYPPFCFVETDSSEVHYRSIIAEIVQRFYKKDT